MAGRVVEVPRPLDGSGSILLCRFSREVPERLVGPEAPAYVLSCADRCEEGAAMRYTRARLSRLLLGLCSGAMSLNS